MRPIHRSMIAVAFAITLSACAAVERAPPPTCGAGLDSWTMTELYFGLAWIHGEITEAQWQEFAAREIVPRMPEGFTVVDELPAAIRHACRRDSLRCVLSAAVELRLRA